MRKMMMRSLKVQEGLAAIGSKVQESLAGIPVVKAYTLEEHEAGLFRKINDAYNEQGLALARTRGAMMPMIRCAAASATMIVLIYGGSLVINGQDVARIAGGVSELPRAARDGRPSRSDGCCRFISAARPR